MNANKTVKRTRILLADDQPKVLSALRLLLEQEVEVQVVGEATDTESLLAQAEATHPDLIILDWGIPGLKTTDLLYALRTRYPHASLVVLSGRPEIRQKALAAGADAFVSKGDSPKQLLTTLRKYGGQSGERLT